MTEANPPTPPDRPPDLPDRQSETVVSISGHAGPAFAPADEFDAGARIGKYTVTRLLGRGGMGAVYEAVDTALQRAVALKVLPRVFTQDAQALQRFVREAQLAAKLNHPNVVAVYDVGEDSGTHYIAMELVRGKSADDLLRSGVKLHHTQATRMVAYACKALAVAHAQDLIHRDVKPANLLVANDKTIKLSDFGLAKLHAAPSHTLTSKDVVLGTPKYMSPEQCQNEPIDGRSDIYSLGATYYALLTGKAPYDSGSTMQILFAHCSKPVPDPREIDADIPEACAAIVRRAMAKDPVDRYATADDMFADLKAVLTPGDTTTRAAASPPSAADDTAPLANVFAALDASDPTQPASPVTPASGTVAFEPSTVFAAPPRQSNTLVIAIAAAAVLVVVAVVGVALLVIVGSGRQATPQPVATAAEPPAEPTPTSTVEPVTPVAEPAAAALEPAESTNPVGASAAASTHATPPELPALPDLPPLAISDESSDEAGEAAKLPELPPLPPLASDEGETTEETDTTDANADDDDGERMAAAVAAARAEFARLRERLTEAVRSGEQAQLRGAASALNRFERRFADSQVPALAELADRARVLLETNRPRSGPPAGQTRDRDRNRPTPPPRR
ncbi:MAG: serine/threonine-protein kinase [Planctomycetota bacterium]